MNSAERSHWLETVRGRSDVIAATWHEAIAGTGDVPLDPPEVRAKLLALTRRLTDVLFAEPFEPRQAEEIGASLADLPCTQPEALGGTLDVLATDMLRGLPSDQAAVLQPRLAASLGRFAAGFCARAYDTILDEQEAIHRTLTHELRDSREASAQVEERTAELSAALERLREEVAEREEVERALRESDRTAKALLRAPTELVALIDREGTILDANQTLALTLGREIDDLLGLRVWDLFPHEVGERRRRYAEIAIVTGQPVRFEDERGGRWHESVFYPVFDEEGRVSRIAALARDITERKSVEAALRESERTARALLRAPTDEALLVDTGGTIVDMSETFAHRFGKAVDELIGSSAWDLLPPSLLEQRLGRVQAVVESGEPTRFEDERQGRWYDNVAYPILDVEGRVARVAVLARDITDRKRMEEALKESERTARALLTAPTYLAALAEPDGVIVDANEALALRFGRSVDELVGVRMWDLLPPDLAERRKGYVKAVIESGQPVRAEDERLGMWFDNVVFPIMDEDGAVARVAVLASDITERKRTEEELRRSLEELEHGQHLLLALSQAAHAVQSARTPDEVHQAIGDQMTALGYQAVVFSLSDDGQHLSVRFTTFEPALQLAAERMMGVWTEGYRIPVEPDGILERTIAQAETVHTDRVVDLADESLPGALKPQASRLIEMLGVEHAILVPLVDDGVTRGLFCVVGSELGENDARAIEVFANEAAIALTNARLYTEARDSAAGLERRVAERTTELQSQIAERRRAEDELRRTQDATLRSNRLLLALGQAAEAVQRAGTREQVYGAIGDEVEGAGYHATVFTLAEDHTHLEVYGLTLQTSVLQAAERLAGLSGRGLRIPLAPGGFFQPLVARGETLFCERSVDLALRSIPAIGRPLMERLVRMLDIERSIFAPLLIDGEIWGVLGVAGSDLTGADVPAVTVFAGQASIALDKARLLAELNTSQKRLRRLTQEVVDTQEVERRRLSRALHDEAGQALTALGISLELIGEDLPPGHDSLRRRIRDAADLTVTTMEGLRRLAQDLRPPALDAVGLSPTLEDACRDFARRTQLSIDYRGTDGPALAEGLNICLYRFLQEALTNVARHARADNVHVALERDAEAVRLSVGDDGRGFDVQPALSAPSTSGSPAGIGLLGMQERLESLGGRLDIDSQPGQGARLVACVPLEEDVP